MNNIEQSVFTPTEDIHQEKDGPDFRSFVEKTQQTNLGEVVSREDIPSTLGPFLYSREYKTQYPKVISSALESLFVEYNRAFIPLVAKNREWETDYQFATSEFGTPINYFVQIDMVGIPDEYFYVASGLSETRVREVLRRNTFEIENSMAMYGLLQGIFSHDEERSLFENRFRASLDMIRQKHKMPIALLAVTDQKHQALREIEFGKHQGETLTDDEVRNISGFDRLFGPGEFLQHLERSGGKCGYLLYARTSDPVSKLRKPDTRVDIPLLENAQTRKAVKANAITFNVDNPALDSISPRRINDTKAYLSLMGMGYEIFDLVDLNSPDFRKYLLGQHVDPDKVANGEVSLRAKPLQGTYGCYGHVRGRLPEGEFRRELRRNLLQRGRYVIQPEMPIPTMINSHDGTKYVFIDRNFLFTDGVNKPVFIGGFRSLIPIDSIEAKNGRIHGSSTNVVAEIT